MIDYLKMKDETSEVRAAKLKEYQSRIERESLAYVTVILDCMKSPRLNEWEERFIMSRYHEFEQNTCCLRKELSEKQEQKLKQIEKKVYDVG